MNNYHCLICKRITNEGVTMPRGSDYAGQVVCAKCVSVHFDKAIREARQTLFMKIDFATREVSP